MYMPSAFPCSTTFVSPPTTVTPARAAASAIARTSASSTGVGSPASSTKVVTSAIGLAPDTARSLTVPLTASSPIDPPGKRSGRTTKLSVVTAMFWPLIDTRAASSSVRARASSPPSSGTMSPSTRRRLAVPPAPCAISIWASLNRIFGGETSVTDGHAQPLRDRLIAPELTTPSLRCS